ncbi:MAG TPA: hypothetical protein VJT67_17330 [Longimicrobiaceae bacterium]|nr:hypothetical protein [Longimicrobiaceae bacterium]
MTRTFRVAVLLLALPFSGARAQAPESDTTSAAWVVRQFYASHAFPGLAAHITGEYKENYATAATMGSRLPPGVAVTSRPLLADAQQAVFATALRDTAKAEDWYTYLRREQGVWKIEAVRTLALPPLVYMLLDTLQEGRKSGTLGELDARLLENLRLTTQSDSALKAYLVAHQPALLAVAQHFAAIPGAEGISEEGKVRGSAPEAGRRQLAAELRALHLNGVMRLPSAPHCIFIVIGGMLDNQVGYIYAPDGCAPPPLSPSEYIYVERVAPGWYIYKTT